MAHAYDEDEDSRSPGWPPLHALAKAWDGHDLIRAQVRNNGKLLSWPSPSATGVASKASMKLNRFSVQIVLRVWGGTCLSPKSPPIGWLREEVGLWHVKVLHAAMHACTIYGSVALLGEGDPQTPEPQRGPGCHVCRRVGPEKAGFQVRQSLSNGAADVPGPRVLACSMLCTSNPFQTKLILLFVSAQEPLLQPLMDEMLNNWTPPLGAGAAPDADAEDAEASPNSAPTEVLEAPADSEPTAPDAAAVLHAPGDSAPTAPDAAAVLHAPLDAAPTAPDAADSAPTAAPDAAAVLHAPLDAAPTAPDAADSAPTAAVVLEAPLDAAPTPRDAADSAPTAAPDATVVLEAPLDAAPTAPHATVVLQSPPDAAPTVDAPAGSAHDILAALEEAEETADELSDGDESHLGQALLSMSLSSDSMEIVGSSEALDASLPGPVHEDHVPAPATLPANTSGPGTLEVDGAPATLAQKEAESSFLLNMPLPTPKQLPLGENPPLTRAAPLKTGESCDSLASSNGASSQTLRAARIARLQELQCLATHNTACLRYPA